MEGLTNDVSFNNIESRFFAFEPVLSSDANDSDIISLRPSYKKLILLISHEKISKQLQTN